MERYFFKGQQSPQNKLVFAVDKPVFNGTMSIPNDSGKLMLTGMLGKDSMEIILQKLNN